MSHNTRCTVQMIEKAARDGLNLANQSEVQEAAAQVNALLEQHKAEAAKLAEQMKEAQEKGDSNLLEKLRSETDALHSRIEEVEQSLLQKISSYALSWQKPVAGEYSLSTDVPAGPEGERFIVGTPETPVPSDPFNSYAGYIATRSGDGWTFSACSEGFTTYDQKANVVKLYSDSGEFVEVARFLGDELVHEDELAEALGQVDSELRLLIEQSHTALEDALEKVRSQIIIIIDDFKNEFTARVDHVEMVANQGYENNKKAHEAFVAEQVAKDASQDIKIGQNRDYTQQNAEEILAGQEERQAIFAELDQQKYADESLLNQLQELAGKQQQDHEEQAGAIDAGDAAVREQAFEAVKFLKEETQRDINSARDDAAADTNEARKEASRQVEAARNEASDFTNLVKSESEEADAALNEKIASEADKAAEARQALAEEAQGALEDGLSTERSMSEDENRAVFSTLKMLESQLMTALFQWETVDGSQSEFEVCFDGCRTVNFIVTPGDPETGVDMVFRLPTEGLPEYNMTPENYIKDPESQGLKSGEHWGESCGRCDMDGLTIKIVTTDLGGGKVRVVGGENPVNSRMSGYEIDCDEGAIEVVYTSMGWIIAP
jgi:hypothetical protein